MKYSESLQKLGLTLDQAKLYEILLKAPLLPVRVLAQKAGVGRELTYVVLGQLEALGLVERSTEGKIALYRASNPRHVKRVLEAKQETVLAAQKAYEDIIMSMIGDFNTAHSKPYVRFHEGMEGLQKTYGHILRHAKTVYVFRSLYDYENKELRTMVEEQLEKQAEKKIRSYVLTPGLDHMKPEKLTHSMSRNITRKIVAKEKFILPSQVLIYNNTVSITSMRKEIVTTIIENEDIAKTFLTLFKYIWDSE